MASHYLAINFRARRPRATAATTPSTRLTLREGDGSARIVEAWFEDEHRRAARHVRPRRADARCERGSHVHEPLSDPIFSVVFTQREASDPVFAASSMIDQHETGTLRQPGDLVEVVLEFENSFAPGRYSSR